MPATAPLVPALQLEEPSFERGLRRALDAIAALPPLPVRSAAVATSYDRVLAERVRADADLPARAVAGVEGYAVASAACRGAGPWRLRVTGRIAAAHPVPEKGGLVAREVVKVAPGSSMPSFLDAVLPVETVRRDGSYIHVAAPPVPGAGIRPRAAVARCGDALAQPDRLLDPRTVAVLATAGCGTVKVRRTLRVAILSTGGARQDGPGAAGRAMLGAALDRRWITCRDLGGIGSGGLVRGLQEAAEEADVIVALDRGGLAGAVREAGGRVVLDGLAMHPGGGAGLAMLGGTAVVMLPVEPVDALTAMAVLGWPAMRRRAGIQHGRVTPRTGIAAFSLPADPARAAYPLVRVAGAGEVPTLEAVADAVGGEDEGDLARLARADGLAILLPGQGVRFGGQVSWMPLGDRYA